MGALSVVRWTRYGHDRLYVKTLGGDPVGWGDLRTGAVHVTDEDLGGLLHQTLAEHPVWSEAMAARAGETEHREPASSIGGATQMNEEQVGLLGHEPGAPRDPVWTDLGTNDAGAQARAQALAAREAAPVLTFAARVLRVHTNERAWRIGADGEEKVAAQLEKLIKKDPRWRVLHAVPVGSRGSDIDHVAIGPGGVFTLNAKHHPGAKIWVRGDQILVNGHFHAYARNSRFEAERASRFLSGAVGRPVIVTGVVVPVRAESVTVKEHPADVWVVTRRHIQGWLRRRPQVLSDAEVTEIYDVARRSTTWQAG
jgi:hypothetical protein